MTQDRAAAANRLAQTTSPYLLQHANNPVDWWPWSDEAFAQADAEGKPVLLSIGYAACHWCHVMAHESFEDPAIAVVMNELFINIKVDREERPDVDHVYMNALHSLGEPGGWPLTMFLNADRQPFWGGTYFPPSARYGRPGFVQVLREVARLYEQEPDRVRHNAQAIGAAIAARTLPASGQSVTAAEFDALADKLVKAIDPVHGGLRGAPKFPNAGLLEWLWRAADHSGGESERADSLYARVLLTLTRMARGGIQDHLAGGFARYSVDERWLVPHFEKMLYDNAQLLELYALAFAKTGDPLFKHTAESIVAWLSREMRLPGGAFASSLDADSEGEEGRFYVWSSDEIQSLLGEDGAALMARFYDVTPQGNWEGKTILNQLATPEPDPTEAAALAILREKLLEDRAGRVRPGQDDKVLADWNGLMIAALARAAPLLGHPEWIDLAKDAYRFIAESMADEGHLAHAWRGHVSVPEGFALDHAAMARAAIALFEQTGESAFRDDALRWTRILIERFRDDDGILSMAPLGRSDLPVSARPTNDDAVPNANGVFLENLVRLLPYEEGFRARIDHAISSLAPVIKQNGFAHASIWNAIDLYLRSPTVVVAGHERAALLEIIRTVPFPNRILVDLAEGDALAPESPAAAQIAGAGSGAAFICSQGRCSLPIRDPAEVKRALAS